MTKERKLTDLERIAIVSRYQDGESKVRLAQAFHVSSPTIHQALVDSGVTVRASRKYSVNHHFFSNIDSHAKAWLVGFISADGCLPKVRQTWNIGVATKDSHLVEQIRLLVGYTGPILYRRPCSVKITTPKKTYVANGTGFTRLTISSPQMVADLKSYGLTPAKSLTLEAWDCPEEFAPGYLLGLIDGDGSWHKTGAGYSCSLVGTRSIVGYFARFIEKHTGYQAKLRQATGCQVNTWTAACTNRNCLQTLARILYKDATIWLDRKRAIAEEVLSLPPVDRNMMRRWPDMTAERLQSLFDSLGSWPAVAESLDASIWQVFTLRQNLGMEILDQVHDFTEAELREAYDRFQNWEMVAEHFGTCLGTLIHYRRKFGMDVRVAQHPFTETQLNQLYAELGSWNKVAKHLGVKKQVLQYIRQKRLGMGKMETARNLSQEQIQEAFALCGNWSDTAKHLKVSINCLTDYRRKYGMKLRPCVRSKPTH